MQNGNERRFSFCERIDVLSIGTPESAFRSLTMSKRSDDWFQWVTHMRHVIGSIPVRGCQRNPPTNECDWNRRKPYFNIRVPFWLPSIDRSLVQILLSWSIDGSCRNRMDSLSSFVLSPLQLVTMSETVSMEATATAEGQ